MENNRQSLLRRWLILAVTVGPTLVPAHAQFHAKREAKLAESGAVQNVKGGITFQIALPYDKTYEGALNFLKRGGYTIDSASAETGQVVTAMDIKGGYTQTGTRVILTCIKDSDSQTSVRVLVTEQKRKKLLQTEPWGQAKANDDAAAKLADAIRAAIGGPALPPDHQIERER